MGQGLREDGAIYDLVHAPLLRQFPELVTALGGQPERMLRAEGIDPAALSEGRPAATYRQLLDLLERAAGELACPDFGMRLAQTQGGYGVYGPLGAVMRHSRSFGEALDYVCNHAYAHSLAARIWRHVERDSGLVFIGHDVLVERASGRAQAIEQILLLGKLGAGQLTGGHARARRVHLRHQPVSAPGVYRRHFGCEVRFGQGADGVFYAASDLACPVLGLNSDAYAAATAYIEANFTQHHPPLHAEVRGMIMRRIGVFACGNLEIADALGLHPRTLHRRLAAEGTSFQRVKDEVRREMLRYYVERTELAFAEVSERLGFAEQSVMTRLCNRWLGGSPTRLRAECGQKADA